MFIEIQVYSSWFQIFGYVPLSTHATFCQFVIRFPDIPTLILKEEVALPSLLYEVCRTALCAYLALPLILYVLLPSPALESELYDLAQWCLIKIKCVKQKPSRPKVFLKKRLY